MKAIALALALVVSASCSKQKPANTAGPANLTEPAAPPAGAAPAAGTTYATADEAGAAAIALLDKMKAAVTGAAGDCAKMGAGLKALTPEVKEMEARAKEFEKDPVKKKEFDDKHTGKLGEHMQSWLPEVEKCADNEEVKAFFASFAS